MASYGMNAPAPVAVVGIGCRFPGGASSPERFWSNLCAGADSIRPIPGSRWDPARFFDDDPDASGKSYVKEGGFLEEDIEQFDPLFFGLAPREAEVMDPQQRLLLEVCYEAIEDAGQRLEDLAGSRSAVFVGGFILDNMVLRNGPFGRPAADSRTATSASMTLLANRLSYVFDLRGPSVSVDTACSSSLVAVHLACQSLWSGDADRAFAGGVNVMLLPDAFVTLSKAHFLSRHGRCRSFDALAQGYARGEGAGVVVLRRLEDAIRDGDRIYAVIRATGCNQDGRTPGITLPNAAAQETLLREVYARADVTPAGIHYIEAHGTGTQAGDRAELSALGRYFEPFAANGRRWWIGSTKSNIGHLEAAAGIASLIKTILVLRSRRVPPNLHFETPNPELTELDRLFCVPRSVVNLGDDQPLRASVNSFGYGGTNAHVLLEEHVPEERGRSATRTTGLPYVLPLSARSPEALRAFAHDTAAMFDQGELIDHAHALGMRRSHFENRAAVLVTTAQEARSLLGRLSAGEPDARVLTSSGAPFGSPLVFVVSGMGPQWWGMGRDLKRTEPVFRESIERCDALFAPLSGFSIAAEMDRDEASSRMARTEVAQPASFVLQVALVDLLRSWGITPAAVVGHSAGEVCAAYVAGVLSLEDAVRVSLVRSRAQQRTSGRGAMLATGLSEARARELVGRMAGLSLAAVNAANATTLAGDPAAIESAARELDARGVFARRLEVDVAYHSRQMDPLRDEILEDLDRLALIAPSVPFYSSVTARPCEVLDAEYWWSNVRQPVRFADAFKALLNDGYRAFVEIGPHPVLRHAMQETAAAGNVAISLFESLNRKLDEVSAARTLAARLYVTGHALRWTTINGETNVFRRVAPYPFQRSRYWSEPEALRRNRLPTSPGTHPLLARSRIDARRSFESPLTLGQLPFLGDHCLGGTAVFPGVAYIEAALAIANVSGRAPRRLHRVEFRNMLRWRSDCETELCTTLDEDTGAFSLFSVQRNEREWSELHARATVAAHELRPDPAAPFPEPPPEARALDVARLYERLFRLGLEYGPRFRSLESLVRAGAQLWAKLAVPPEYDGEAASYDCYPPLLDGVLQAMLALVPESSESAYLPVAVREVRWHGAPLGTACRVHVSLEHVDARRVIASARVVGLDASPRLDLLGVECRAVELRADSTEAYHVGWQFVPFSATPSTEALPSGLPPSTSSPSASSPSGLPPSASSPSASSPSALSPSTSSPSALLLLHHAGDPFSPAAIEGSPESGIAKMVVLPAPGADATERVRAALDGTATVAYLVPVGDLGHQNPHERLASIAMSVTEIALALAERRPATLALVVPEARETTSEFSDSVGPAIGALAAVIEQEMPGVECRVIESAKDVPIEATLATARAGGPERDVRITTDGVFQRRLRRGWPAGSVPDLRCRPRSVPLTLAAERSFSVVRASQQEIRSDELVVQVKWLEFPLARSILARGWKGRAVAAIGTVQTPSGQRNANTVVVLDPPSNGSLLAVPESRLVRLATEPLPGQAAVAFERALAQLSFGELSPIRTGEAVYCGLDDGAFVAEIQARALAAGAVVVRDSSGDHGGASLATTAIVEATPDGVARACARVGAAGRVQALVLAGRPTALDLAALGTFTRLDLLDLGGLVTARGQDITRSVQAILESPPTKPLPTVSPVTIGVTMAKEPQSTAEAALWPSHAILAEPGVVEPARADGTYVITGGAAGLGLELACALSRCGAARVVLLSRRGASPEALARVRGEGSEVVNARVDVSNAEAMGALFQDLGRAGPPVRGIIHGAVVLDDGWLRDMTRTRYAQVFAAKVTGAHVIVETARACPLDYLVFLSSISGIIGNPGQANYVVANAYLDALARALRARGTRATSIQLGPITDVGVAARAVAADPIRSGSLLSMLSTKGLRGLEADEAVRGILRTIRSGPAGVGLFGAVDWHRFVEMNPEAATAGLYAEVRPDTARAASRLAEMLMTVEPAEVAKRLEALLSTELAAVLKMEATTVDPSTPLSRLGMDSLLALEFAASMQERWGVHLSSMELLSGPSIADLAQSLRKASGL